MFFDGESFSQERDGERLSTQFLIVKGMLLGGGWLTIAEMAIAAGGSDASISARVRDLRKPRFGGYDVQRRYVADGVWEYRIAIPGSTE